MTATKTWSLSLLLGASAVMLVAGGCDKAAATAKDRICTAGNYVFCRCEDRSEGTKLCHDDGQGFDKCDCGGELGEEPPPLSPNGDAGFEPVDSGPTPADAGPSIDAKCAGKLAVLASSEEDLYLFGAAYSGNGAWTVGKSLGPALRSQPRGVLLNNVLVAAWRSRYDLIAWTKFESGQTSLAPPISIGSAITAQAPAMLATQTAAKIYYLGADNTHFEGTYSAASGWDDATTAVPTPVMDGGVNIPGKSAPAAAAVGTSSVLGFTGTDKSLARQTYSSGAWGTPIPIASAEALAQAPALVALSANATKDMLMVYVGSDLLLHSTTRTTSNKAWNTAILVDTTASPTGVPQLAAIANGRAMLVWRASNGTPFFSVFDSALVNPWTVPAELLPGRNPSLASSLSVVAGRCGSEATAAYAEKGGNVSLALFQNGAWTGPYPVPGMTNMTFAGAGEVP